MLNCGHLVVQNDFGGAIDQKIRNAWSATSREEVAIFDCHGSTSLARPYACNHFQKISFLSTVVAYKTTYFTLFHCKVIDRRALRILLLA